MDPNYTPNTNNNPPENTPPPVTPLPPQPQPQDNPYTAAAAPVVTESSNETRSVSATGSEEKNYLAAFLLASNLGFIGINRFYTGHNKIGWIRLGLFVGALVVPLLLSLVSPAAGSIASILSGLAILAVYIWAYADMWFYYLNKVNDNETGKPLAQHSKKDHKYAKVIMIVIHVIVALYILVLVASFSFLAQQFNGGSGGTSPQGLDTFQQAPLEGGSGMNEFDIQSQ